MIAYLSITEREFLDIFAERAAYFLNRHQISAERFHEAFLFLTGPGKTITPQMMVVHGCLALSGAVDGPRDKLGHEAREWIFADPRVRAAFETYFEYNQDRDIAERYVWIIGICAIVCFILLFFRFAHPTSNKIFGGFEVFFIIFTFMMNVFTYLFLLRTWRMKGTIKDTVTANLKNAVDAVKVDVTDAAGQAEKLRRDLQNRANDASKRKRGHETAEPDDI